MVSSLLHRRHTHGSSSNLSAKGNERVPQTLQTVLIVASRGKEVTKPPPCRVANRTFRRFFNNRGKTVHDHNSSEIDDSLASSEEFELSDGIPKVISSGTMKSLQTAAATPVHAVTKHHVSPQTYVTSQIKNRGYSDATFKSVETAYYNKPTPFQVASHGTKVIESIRTDNVSLLKELMDVGLSPNACNEHGESIVHMICRMGKKDMLQVLLDHGCTLQVADDYGRTPLHDACWSTQVNFELVDLILERDPRLLFIQDSRGSLPLSYLPETQWTAWTKYLMSRKDRFWPERCIIKEGVQPDPVLATLSPNSLPIPDPKDVLPLELARMVAQGRMSPMEAAMLKDDDTDSTESDEDLDCDSDDDSCSHDESSEYEDDGDDHKEVCRNVANATNDESAEVEDLDDDWSESAFDESEMEEILGCLGRGQAIAWSS